jgi:chromodomain-helicase-DNA-binding protein 7
MVVDEAHRLKGENSKITQAIKMYQSQWKLLMTGTPIQNNMRELFILLNLLHPEEHPSWDDFKGKFCNADGTLNPEMVTDLHEMLRPVLLRRMKEDVETIPCKEEVVVWVDLTYEQRRWYKAMMEDKVGYLVQGKGRDAPTLRNLCMELRKVCNHPLLCDGVESEIQERYAILHGCLLVLADHCFERIGWMVCHWSMQSSNRRQRHLQPY